MSKKKMGSSIDNFLEEEGLLEEVQEQAVNEVVGWERAKETNDGNHGLEQEFGGVER